jgi:hypothetical protein
MHAHVLTLTGWSRLLWCCRHEGSFHDSPFCDLIPHTKPPYTQCQQPYTQNARISHNLWFGMTNMNKHDSRQGKWKSWSQNTDQGKWRSNKLLKNIISLQQFKMVTGSITIHQLSHYSECRCCIIERILTKRPFHNFNSVLNSPGSKKICATNFVAI